VGVVGEEVKRERKIYKNWSIPATHYNYFDVCVMEGIDNVTAKNAINILGVEGIKNLEQLKPVEHLFEVFEKARKGGMRRQYGIRRRHYDYWKKTGKVPKLSPGIPPIWKQDDSYTNINIPIKKDLYDRFKHMVDNANSLSLVKIAYREMIYIAMDEAIQRRPQFADSAIAKGGGKGGKGQDE